MLRHNEHRQTVRQGTQLEATQVTPCLNIDLNKTARRNVSSYRSRQTEGTNSPFPTPIVRDTTRRRIPVRLDILRT